MALFSFANIFFSTFLYFWSSWILYNGGSNRNWYFCNQVFNSVMFLTDSQLIKWVISKTLKCMTGYKNGIGKHDKDEGYSSPHPITINLELLSACSVSIACDQRTYICSLLWRTTSRLSVYVNEPVTSSQSLIQIARGRWGI